MSEEAIVSTAPTEPAPVVQAEAVPATPAVEATADGEKPEEVKTGDTPEKRETPRWLQKRIDKITRQHYEQKARADFLEKQNAELKPKAVVSEGAPTLEQFEFDVAAHAEASAKFYGEKAARELYEKQRTHASQQYAHQLASEWESSAEKATEKYDDFDQVVGDLKPESDLIASVMRAGPDVAYFMGTAKNRAEAIRIANLHPIDRMIALGELKAKLSAEPQSPAVRSNAPVPIKPVGGSASPSVKKLSEMTQEEFEKRRRDTIAKRR